MCCVHSVEYDIITYLYQTVIVNLALSFTSLYSESILCTAIYYTAMAHINIARITSLASKCCAYTFHYVYVRLIKRCARKRFHNMRITCLYKLLSLLCLNIVTTLIIIIPLSSYLNHFC